MGYLQPSRQSSGQNRGIEARRHCCPQRLRDVRAGNCELLRKIGEGSKKRTRIAENA